jgi:hypothetical protein
LIQELDLSDSIVARFYFTAFFAVTFSTVSTQLRHWLSPTAVLSMPVSAPIEALA